MMLQHKGAWRRKSDEYEFESRCLQRFFTPEIYVKMHLHDHHAVEFIHNHKGLSCISCVSEVDGPQIWIKS